MVLADGGGLDLHTTKGQLLDAGDKVNVHVLGENIGGPGDALGAEIQLIQDAGHRPGIGGVHVPDVQFRDLLAGGLGRLLVHGALAL